MTSLPALPSITVREKTLVRAGAGGRGWPGGRAIGNGPNALPGQTSGQLQAGQGMLHGVRPREGRAEWYRNRWVRTGSFTAARLPARTAGST